MYLFQGLKLGDGALLFDSWLHFLDEVSRLARRGALLYRGDHQVRQVAVHIRSRYPIPTP